MNGEVKIIKPADPDKLKHLPKTVKKPRLDKMGRKISEKNGMTEDTANRIFTERTKRIIM